YWVAATFSRTRRGIRPHVSGSDNGADALSNRRDSSASTSADENEDGRDERNVMKLTIAAGVQRIAQQCGRWFVSSISGAKYHDSNQVGRGPHRRLRLGDPSPGRPRHPRT